MYCDATFDTQQRHRFDTRRSFHRHCPRANRNTSVDSGIGRNEGARIEARLEKWRRKAEVMRVATTRIKRPLASSRVDNENGTGCDTQSKMWRSLKRCIERGYVSNGNRYSSKFLPFLMSLRHAKERRPNRIVPIYSSEATPPSRNIRKIRPASSSA